MTTYTFDVVICATYYIEAENEEEALEKVYDQAGYDGAIVQEPELIEIDGEAI